MPQSINWGWIASIFSNKDQKRKDQRERVTASARRAFQLAANGEDSTEAFQRLRENLNEANKNQ